MMENDRGTSIVGNFPDDAVVVADERAMLRSPPMTADAPPKTNALVDAIRKGAPAGIWSSGVKLARAEAVAIESRDGSEVVLRVRTPGRPVAPTVVLYPNDLDWDCDCPGRVRPCDHIVAAALSLAEGADRAAKPAAATTSWARIAYRFSRAEGGLKVTRAIVRRAADGALTEAPVDASLAVLRIRPDFADLHLEELDLRADLLLESGARGILPPSKLDALLTVLVGARQVALDGRPVHRAGNERLLTWQSIRVFRGYNCSSE